MGNEEKAALAYQIATGRTLEDREAVVRWVLNMSEWPHYVVERRAVEAMIPWLDEVVTDDDTRSRLGLVVYPAWVADAEYDGLALLLEPGTIPTAIIDASGWSAFDLGAVDRDGFESPRVGHGPETGTAGMDAAEAALRRAGVLPEGVTVRRPGGGAS